MPMNAVAREVSEGSELPEGGLLSGKTNRRVAWIVAANDPATRQFNEFASSMEDLVKFQREMLGFFLGAAAQEMGFKKRK